MKAKRAEEEQKRKEEAIKSPSKQLEPHALQNFLERNMQVKQVFLNITDMKEWRKKHRVEPETKVFICKGGYGDVKRALK